MPCILVLPCAPPRRDWFLLSSQFLLFQVFLVPHTTASKHLGGPSLYSHHFVQLFMYRRCTGSPHCHKGVLLIMFDSRIIGRLRTCRDGTEKCKVTVNLWISGRVPIVSYSLTFRKFYWSVWFGFHNFNSLETTSGISRRTFHNSQEGAVWLAVLTHFPTLGWESCAFY